MSGLFEVDVLIRGVDGRGDFGRNTHCEHMDWFGRKSKRALLVRLCYSEIRSLQKWSYATPLAHFDFTNRESLVLNDRATSHRLLMRSFGS